MDEKRKQYLSSFVLVYVASLASMLWLLTISIHSLFRKIVWEEWFWGFYHALAIAVLPGLLGILIYRRGKLFKFIFGLIIGPIVGTIYVQFLLNMFIEK